MLLNKVTSARGPPLPFFLPFSSHHPASKELPASEAAYLHKNAPFLMAAGENFGQKDILLPPVIHGLRRQNYDLSTKMAKMEKERRQSVRKSTHNSR